MKHLLFEVDSRGVARLSLNRPEIRNAFNDELISEVTQTFSGLDSSIRVLVLSGEGKVFCAGADLEWMRSMANFSSDQNLQDSSNLRDMLKVIDSCPIPIVGKIHGAAVAGATGLVACCDYAVAAEGTAFAFTEVRLGLVPAIISPYVVRKVGYSFARAMFMTAERFDADRALEVGLIHRVTSAEGLDAAVEEIVEMFLAGGPGAMRSVRRLVDEVLGRPPDEVGDLTVKAISEARVSEEGQEGVGAFLEKRDPRWKSR